MKRTLTMLMLGCLGGLGLYAQAPKADLFLGYTMLRANSSQDIDAFTMNGGIGTLGINFNNHIGAEFEFGGYTTGFINGYSLDTTNLTYLFGPRLSYGRSKTVDPYVHALFGGTRLTTSATSPIVQPCAECRPRYLAASQANFAMAIGGGLDIKLGKSFAIRPVQIDYLLTRLETLDINNPSGPSSNRNQNNFRYCAGIIFNFGGGQ